MFEFDKSDRSGSSVASAPCDPYQPFEGGRRRSFLLWGEHCIECAAPDCYSSCNLYQARPDKRCRRFEYGALKNRNFASSAGHGAEVRFKRWGKLEARGNATLLPGWQVKCLETLVMGAAPLVNRLGKLADRVLKDIRFSYATHSILERLNDRLRKRGAGKSLPDAFVAEIYNPTDTSIDLLLSMSVDRTRLSAGITPDRLPPPFPLKLSVPPGYFRRDIPREALAHLLEPGLPFNIALVPAADGAHLIFLTLEFVEYRKAAALAEARAPAKLPPAKCVIFDLDNTLWEGILLEGEVRLRPNIRTIFETLDERGILLSVASKNSHEDALAKLREYRLEELLVFPTIGWQPKSEMVRAIAQQINIGLDSVIFIDDNVFERDQVSRSLGLVEVLPDGVLTDLLDHPRLVGSATLEARARRLMYQQSMQRDSASASFGGDYVEFLRSCDIKVEIRRDAPGDLERIAELVQRTNQLNFSGHKYTPAEVSNILSDPSAERYVIGCSDRYGSYGIVGFCMVDTLEDGVIIKDLMLSCRVQGKQIERALLHRLAFRSSWDAKFIEINYVPTARNAAARSVLDSMNFSGPPGSFRLDPVGADLCPDFIEIITPRLPRPSPADIAAIPPAAAVG